MEPAPNYRRMTLAQAEEIHAILAECGLDMSQRFGLDHWNPPYPLEHLCRHLEERDVYGVYVEGSLTATFMLWTGPDPYGAHGWADPAAEPMYLSKLAVRPAWQGRGLGKWCLALAEELARGRGHQALRFDAVSRHTLLVAYYVKAGYQVRGQMGHETGWDITLFEKVLKSTL